MAPLTTCCRVFKMRVSSRMLAAGVQVQQFPKTSFRKTLSAYKEFKSVDQVSGLYFLENVISEEDASEIVKDLVEDDASFRIHTDTPNKALRDYGWDMFEHSNYHPYPEWATKLWDTLIYTTNIEKICDFKKEPIDSFYARKYMNGAGISPHMDAKSYLGSHIIGLSLGDVVDMDFSNYDHDVPYQHTHTSGTINVYSKGRRKEQLQSWN